MQLLSLRCETWHQPRLGASNTSHQVSAVRQQPPRCLSSTEVTSPFSDICVQRKDTLNDVIGSTPHGPSSLLHAAGFSWKVTPSTGIPQSPGRCCGAANWLNHCLCLKLRRPDFSTSSAAVTATIDSFVSSLATLPVAFGNLFVVNALELEDFWCRTSWSWRHAIDSAHGSLHVRSR